MTAASVVIAVKDGRETIGRAVRSALDQTLPDIEVIVVDDASRDATAAAAREAAAGDQRLRIVALAENRGPSAARNRGIEAARGRWIAVLDADDSFAPTRLERLVTRAQAASADMACDDLAVFDRDSGRELFAMFARAPLPERIDAAAFVAGNLPDPREPRRGYGFLKPILRRSFLREQGLAYDEEMRFAEDYGLYLGCLLRGAVWVTDPAPLYSYAVHGNSLTASHTAGDLALLCRVDERALEGEPARENPRLRNALVHHLLAARKRERWAAFIAQFKARDYGSLPRTAAHSPAVFAHIAVQCLRQAVVRGVRLVRSPINRSRGG
ncbi:glycosyltransferase family 2 protein [Salinarimonas sp.]|uniref:glycosyltransferase family 2 protein n=1 Tax=Salinarimonas sp. TaxID=2766526 RepID=UPI0032D968DF